MCTSHRTITPLGYQDAPDIPQSYCEDCIDTSTIKLGAALIQLERGRPVAALEMLTDAAGYLREAIEELSGALS